MEMKILIFGSCNIDYVYMMDHIVTAGETERVQSMQIFPGGKGLNQSVAAARAGATVYHAGCIGKDGAMLTEVLQESGVDVSYLKTVDAQTGHAMIQVSRQGENAIFLYPGSNEMLSKSYVDEVLDGFAAGDILLLQNEINQVDYIVTQAHQRGMCIVFNAAPCNERIGEVDFRNLSYLAVNEGEICVAAGTSTPEEGLRYFSEHYPKLKVILTLGEDGSVLVNGEKRWRQAAFAVEAVDTTAAGDTFVGYFAAELANGTEEPQILKMASAASAIAVSKNGAAPSIPQRSEVFAFLNTRNE